MNISKIHQIPRFNTLLFSWVWPHLRYLVASLYCRTLWHCDIAPLWHCDIMTLLLKMSLWYILWQCDNLEAGKFNLRAKTVYYKRDEDKGRFSFHLCHPLSSYVWSVWYEIWSNRPLRKTISIHRIFLNQLSSVTTKTQLNTTLCSFCWKFLSIY